MQQGSQPVSVGGPTVSWLTALAKFKLIDDGTLTVEIQADRCIAFAKFVLGDDFVFSGILDGHIIYLHGRQVTVACLFYNVHLRT